MPNLRAAVINPILSIFFVFLIRSILWVSLHFVNDYYNFRSHALTLGEFDVDRFPEKSHKHISIAQVDVCFQHRYHLINKIKGCGKLFDATRIARMNPNRYSDFVILDKLTVAESGVARNRNVADRLDGQSIEFQIGNGMIRRKDQGW